MLAFAKRTVLASTIAVAASMLLAAPAWATWSIDGVDPDTGQVGVAVASCVPFDVGRVAVVVPGNGAGSSQAKINTGSGEPMAEAMAAGAAPQQVIDAVTAAKFDDDAASRQFGVVLLGKGGAGYSGSKNQAVAVDRRNAAGTASAQGNILVAERVVDDALAAFDRTDGPLAAKLVAALAAGSAAGGDSRCGEQTASSASLIVAEPNDPPWVHTDAPLSGPIAAQAATPSTYVSVVNRRGGANAVTALAAAYESATPVDGKIYVRNVQFGGEAAHPALVLGALAVVLAVIVGIVTAAIRARRRRRARRSVSSDT
ncbi:MAG: DUF1028 domain-containing protein [Actinomycetes bacterium]